jgi:hypothetical protein
MATVLPIANKVVTAQPQGAYYTVAIDTSGFLDTETNNGGRISPCVAEDFATKPTTLAQSRLVSRGALRFKKMLEILQVRSNLNLVNIVTTYASSAGDNPITALAFGIVYDTDQFVPDVGTAVDGSTTTTTRVGYIKDKITEALMGTFTENMPVYNPTTGASDITIESITAAPVLTTSVNEVLDAVTVTEVTAYRPNTSSELASEGAGLADTAE